MGMKECFVCGDVSTCVIDGDNSWRGRKTGGALLENNLNVIFLLRKLVQVPSTQLECQLRESGDNPERWISLCDQCTQLIEKARELDEAIQTIERELEVIKRNICRKIRAGGPGQGTADNKEDEDESYLGNSRDFGSKMRCFLRNYEPNELDDEKDRTDFLEGDGDKLADYLESQGNSYSAAIVLVEKPDEDEQEEIKIEQESPTLPDSPLAVAEDISDHFVNYEDNLDEECHNENENEGKPKTGNDNHFNRSSGLGSHVRLIHEKPSGISCPLCPEVDFETKQNLYKHLFQKHKDESESSIKKVREETGIFLRRCSWIGCGVYFMRQGDEDKHMAKGVHGGGEWEKEETSQKKKKIEKAEKSRTCKYCGKEFRDCYKCRRHEIIHETKGKVQVQRKNTTGKKVVKKKSSKSRNKFKCEICGEMFGWARNWSDHLRSKHDKWDITCPGLECGRIFKDDLSKFIKHWRTSHVTSVVTQKSKRVENRKKKEMLECTICRLKFRFPKSLDRHVKIVHEKQFPITCHLCGRGFYAKTGLHKHLLQKHKDDPVTVKLMEETGIFLRKCKVVGCITHFMRKEQEERHMERIHGGGGGGEGMQGSGERRFKCKYCEMGFWAKWKCRRHERIHETKGKVRVIRRRKSDGWLVCKIAKEGNGNHNPSDKKFKCDICEKRFKWARNWSDHLWNKHEKREITCPGLECRKIFDNLVEFRDHWKTSHVTVREPGEKFICEICGVEKESRNDLYLHRNNSHRKRKKKGDVREFRCGICKDGFDSQRSLLAHKRTVHKVGRDDQPIKDRWRKGKNNGLKAVCNICGGKELSSEFNLKQHVKLVHEKQLDFSCHVCGVKFGFRGQLNMHLLGRHKEDPVVKQLEEVEGLKVIKCGVVGCSSRFLKQVQLDKHVEKMHKGDEGGDRRRFQCKYCGKGFWQGHELRRHERIHEGEGKEDWKCELCGKGFSTKDYLYYHRLMTHKKAKKFQENGNNE